MNSQSLPQPLFQHLASQSVQELEPAWLKLEQNSDTITAIGGAWQHYCEQAPKVGQSATDIFEILIGMLPIRKNFKLPQIQLQSEQYTDIFALRDKDCDWLLCCDVSQNTLQLQRYQQVSNDLILLKARMKQTLHRYVGHEVLTRISNGEMQLDAAGERMSITTLFVDIRGFTPFNERNDAQDVMQALNDYMDCMLPPIMQNKGIVDKIMGDGIMSIFGVLSSNKHPCMDALQAANNMIKHVLQLNKSRKTQQLEQLGIGIGIASGEAVLGILGSHDRRSFTAIGRHVNLAARLESSARVGEILIDEATYQSLKQPEIFLPATLTLKGIGQTNVFSQTQPCIHAD